MGVQADVDMDLAELRPKVREVLPGLMADFVLRDPKTHSVSARIGRWRVTEGKDGPNCMIELDIVLNGMASYIFSMFMSMRWAEPNQAPYTLRQEQVLRFDSLQSAVWVVALMKAAAAKPGGMLSLFDGMRIREKALP